MKNISIKGLCALSALPLVATLLPAASTDPLGGAVVSFPAGSDTSFVPAFNRSVVFEGLVSSLVEGSTDAVITASGIPGWTADQFVYEDGVQDDIFRLVFLSGAREGVYYTITDNETGSITIDLAGDSIDGVVFAGDRFQIIPFWTLDTLFPDGEGIAISSDPFDSSNATKIFLTDPMAEGINNPLGKVYYHYDGSMGILAEGWYLDGNPGAGSQDDLVLVPDSFIVVRQPDGVPGSMTVSGAVPMYNPSTVLNRLATIGQDNYVVSQSPVDLSLEESNLSNTAGFARSSDPFDSSFADKVLVFDNSSVGINKPLDTVYYYYDGSAGVLTEGWYIDGNPAAGLQNDEPVFKAGAGVVIRRAGGPDDSFFWTSNPAYLD